MKKLLFLLIFVNVLFAQSDTPLTLRAQFNGAYGYTIIGNTHNEFDNWQNPTPPCQMLTQSSATLNLLPNQTIVAAYLYWGGIGDGTDDAFIKLNNIDLISNITLLSIPEAPPTNTVYFNSFINVTNQISSTGNGLYTFSDINLNSQLLNFCSSAVYNLGWHIVVVYSQVGLPNNQINIYDGNNAVGLYFNNGITQVPITNLNVVDTANAKMTYVALNGSPNYFDQEAVLFNNNTLSNALNPANNPFNGTNSFTGSTTNWNQDIDTFDISPFIAVGDTQANITLKSVPIRFMQTLVTSIRSELPDATAQLNQVSGQQLCGNRNLTVNYTVANTNSNAALPANLPVSFYADNTLLTTVNTPAGIPIGATALYTANVVIPANIPNTFNLRVVVDNSSANQSTIAESNENNNAAVQSVTLLGNPVLSVFSIPTSFCQNAVVPVLPLVSNNGILGSWSPAVISNQTSGSYVFTPTGNPCNVPFTLDVVVNPSVTPTFNLTTTFCQNATVPVLPLVSANGMAGTWLPSVINNQNSGSYVFTPTNACDVSFTLNVTINPTVTAVFSLFSSFCQGATVPVLPMVSTNGISGSWFPATVSKQASGSYTFTPTAGQCALPFILNTTIETVNTVNENAFLCKNNQNNSTEAIVLNTNLSPLEYSFTWELNSVLLPDITNAITVATAGNYQAIATSNSLGCQQLFNFSISELPPLTATFTTSEAFSTNQSITITATGGSGNYEYSFADLPFQNVATFTTTSGGEIPIIVRDDANCNSVSLVANLINYPKFFTPNGDGFNDTWGINSFGNSTIFIFNRFGKLIKQLTNTESWNGTFNSQNLPADDYWFVINYKNNKTYKGHFALKR